MDIFKQLSSGADVDMAKPEYAEAIKEMGRCNQICFRINTTEPDMETIRPLEGTLFDGGLDTTSYIIPPMQIDFGCQMKIGKGVFINHSLTCMAAGGITIEDGVMIGPNVALSQTTTISKTVWCCDASLYTSDVMLGLAWVPSYCRA